MYLVKWGSSDRPKAALDGASVDGLLTIICIARTGKHPDLMIGLGVLIYDICW